MVNRQLSALAVERGHHRLSRDHLKPIDFKFSVTSRAPLMRIEIILLAAQGAIHTLVALYPGSHRRTT
jgi:hypothetical protein